MPHSFMMHGDSHGFAAWTLLSSYQCGMETLYCFLAGFHLTITAQVLQSARTWWDLQAATSNTDLKKCSMVPRCIWCAMKIFFQGGPYPALNAFLEGSFFFSKGFRCDGPMSPQLELPCFEHIYKLKKQRLNRKVRKRTRDARQAKARLKPIYSTI